MMESYAVNSRSSTEGFAIKIRPQWNPSRPLFVYLYQNKKEWVTRAHVKTCTKFASIDEAQAVITKFDTLRLNHQAQVVKVLY